MKKSDELLNVWFSLQEEQKYLAGGELYRMIEEVSNYIWERYQMEAKGEKKGSREYWLEKEEVRKDETI